MACPLAAGSPPPPQAWFLLRLSDTRCAKGPQSASSRPRTDAQRVLWLRPLSTPRTQAAGCRALVRSCQAVFQAVVPCCAPTSSACDARVPSMWHPGVTLAAKVLKVREEPGQSATHEATDGRTSWRTEGRAACTAGCHSTVKSPLSYGGCPMSHSLRNVPAGPRCCP